MKNMTVPSNFSGQSSSSEVLLSSKPQTNLETKMNLEKLTESVQVTGGEDGSDPFPSCPQKRQERQVESPVLSPPAPCPCCNSVTSFQPGSVHCADVWAQPWGWHTQQLHVLGTGTAPLTAGTKKEQQEEEWDGSKMCLLKCHTPF